MAASRAATVDIARLRLEEQFLGGSDLATGAAVVAALGAVQAQDYSGAKWALGQRTRNATDEAIEREFDGGAILRTHLLRPTWHFVSPADIRWMLALTGPRVGAAMRSYNRRLELDRAVFHRSHRVLEKALAGGRHRTRVELRAALERARVKPAAGQRLAHLMMQAELDAVVCSGPRRGKRFTYALFDERVPPAPALARDEALLELARRYFRTRGPASSQDFAWWSGLAMADVRRAIDIAGRELERIQRDGREYWLVDGHDPRHVAKRIAHLLPNYDEFFIGFRDRSAIGQRLKSVEVVTGGNALIAHVVAIDGQLVGGWKRLPGKGASVVQLDLRTNLTASERSAVNRALRRFQAFVGEPVEVRGLR
jgi:hypothetical protein